VLKSHFIVFNKKERNPFKINYYAKIKVLEFENTNLQKKWKTVANSTDDPFVIMFCLLMKNEMKLELFKNKA